MPGPKRTYLYEGKRRRRHTPYRYLNVREADWFNIHRLADNLRLSLVDTFQEVITAMLEVRGMKPMTTKDLAAMEQTGLKSRS